MRKYFSHAFKITNKSIILVIPLIIIMTVISAYMEFVNRMSDTPAEVILALITLLFMFGAFGAGWFSMVKAAVREDSCSGKIKSVSDWFKVLPAGIGEYFLSFAGVSLVFSVLILLSAVVLYKLGFLLFGALDFDPVLLKQAVISSEGMKIFIESLSDEQRMRLIGWNFLLIFAGGLYSFITLLWVPEVMYGTGNPVKALWFSIKKIFQKFLKSAELFLYISLLYFLVLIAGTFLMYNPVTYIIAMMMNFYFTVYFVVLIFSYYEAEYKSDSNSGSDSLRQDGLCG
ncbi:MAG: hypothetical protein LBK53_05295 [Heliobacteriaceae bacterium]|jgi:hypothetical protein|nr:hypothetical protein [Heliobacteriaceae bacterium]